MPEVTLAEFKALMLEGRLVWPPFREPKENRVYAITKNTIAEPSKFVWYDV